MVPTTLIYKLSPLTKTEVVCNYNKGTIKLTLWRSCIKWCIFIQQVNIKEWLKVIISLTTIPSTCIKISEKNIQKSKPSLKELIS